MSTRTPTDVVTAAMSIAKDAAEGRLAPAELERQAVAELRELVGTVIGPDDPAWPLQCDIARQVLALDGIPATELAEWLAMARHRAGEPLSAPEPAETPPELESSGGGDLEAGSAGPELAEAELVEQPAPELEPQPPADVQPAPLPPARRGEYDPLAGWPASRSLRG
ncbi:flagellar hook-length control protein [Mycobacterium persicum]|uniref:flagellar hook-length control protein n=1 Tax=Mycobacterium persicum TaxID=1487726 RepID=UPI000C07E499|nr:flagellar hook-length control protein [Mycobacterium persicum]